MSNVNFIGLIYIERNNIRWAIIILDNDKLVGRMKSENIAYSRLALRKEFRRFQ